MPTPSPIMVASVGETLANVEAAASSPSSPSPTTTPNSAVTSGSSAAATLPNAASSTTTATPKPIASLVRSVPPGRASSPSGPPYSTWTPARRSGAVAASTPCR
jgi:hypothetical protein